MWIKQTEEELNQHRKHKRKIRIKDNLAILFITACFLIVSFFVNRKTGISLIHDRKPLTWTEALAELPGFLNTMSLWLVIIILIFVFFNIPLFSSDPKLFICEKCNDKKYNLKDNFQCTCGNTYEDADTLKWVEDD